jgi:ADP-ribosyl-[dinitrogen reductase] hydrolase
MERAQGALVGLGVGDALGGPLEFMSSEAIMAQYGGSVSEMVGGGWLHLAPGQITDDTQMALCLARSLASQCGYDRADVLHRYLDWLALGPLDVGATIASVLHSITSGTEPDEASQQYHVRSLGRSAGNGSIMRIAPLALACQTPRKTLASIVRAESTLTHYDPLAAESCMVMVTLIRAFLYAPEYDFQCNELKELLGRLSADMDDQVHAAALADCDQAAHQARNETGFVLTALAVGCAAVCNFDSFEQGLVWAVNLGGDADTNGAVAGSMLGAKFGIEAIPARWRAVLQHREELESLAETIMGLQTFER